ncbi:MULTISPECIES: hypothetical protein [Pantoea]|uniref:hypothetical protein n=1 Tax=Pantoea TaxID=53335 RepID=UPI001AE2AA23|nr:MULTISPECIES: hypothetical protein [Pantoea]
MERHGQFKTTDLINSLSGEDKELAYTALCLYKFVFNESMKSCQFNNRKNNIFLSYMDIREYFNESGLKMRCFSDSLKILCNPEVHILNLKYVFIDELNNQTDVRAEDVEEAYELGSFQHPFTGDLIYNYKKYIFPFFVPSKPLMEMKGDLCQE